MKYILIFALGLFIFSGCRKDRMSVRIKNNLNYLVTSVKAGDAEFGNIKTGEFSEYETISPGKFTIHVSSTGPDIDGNGEVKGFGKHKWTIYISVDGKFYVSQD